MIKGTRNKRDELFGYEMTEEAKEVLSRIPFFVRKRVRKRVEEEATNRKAGEVTLEHVRTCQKRFLNRMEDELLIDKTLLFMGRNIEKFPLCVKPKSTS